MYHLLTQMQRQDLLNRIVQDDGSNPYSRVAERNIRTIANAFLKSPEVVRDWFVDVCVDVISEKEPQVCSALSDLALAELLGQDGRHTNGGLLYAGGAVRLGSLILESFHYTALHYAREWYAQILSDAKEEDAV